MKKSDLMGTIILFLFIVSSFGYDLVTGNSNNTIFSVIIIVGMSIRLVLDLKKYIESRNN